MVRPRPRPDAPPALLRNARAWTARWVRLATAGAGGDWATARAKKELKGPLLTLTWGKCAFCEGRLGAQAYAQIEHYVSRKVDPQRAFEWENLLPVCQVCNTSKGHADHQGRLLKPDAENPEPFFWITYERVMDPHPTLNEADKVRALETIRLCGLNRPELVASRQAVGDFVMRWIARSALGIARDQHLEAEWTALSNPCFNYKIVVRHVLTQKGLHVRAEKDREIFQRGR